MSRLLLALLVYLCHVLEVQTPAESRLPRSVIVQRRAGGLSGL